MRHILVVVYSQSGQLERIAEVMIAPLRARGFEVSIERLQPVPAFPFPWSLGQFLDVFPECVEQVPCALAPLRSALRSPPDLVVLCYQPWYLSPSIPIASFLRSDDGRALLRERPVVTITAGRNMWMMADEAVCSGLAAAGARRVGHVALVDRAPNLVSLVTTLRWMLTGRRDRFGLLPGAGVNDVDVTAVAQWGEVLAEQLGRGEPMASPLFPRAAAHQAPRLVLLERAALRAFRLWARFVRGDGRRSRGRALRVVLFACAFVPSAMFLFPSTFVVASLRQWRARRRAREATLDASS